MSISNIGPGSNVPDEINVVIEIPSQSDPVKYEFDKETGAMFVDRFMATAMFYPCNYGYMPATLSEDGDPVDVLVITPAPLLSGTAIKCRPIGVLKMEDEKGPDAKVLAVPTDSLTTGYKNYHSPDDVPSLLLSTLTHFFEHYKDLEEGKWVKVDSWYGADEAKKEIVASVKRYKKRRTEVTTL